jgi:DNA-binding GntR family transcriptional regulator
VAYLQPVHASVVKLVPTRREPIYTLLEREYDEPILEVQQEFRALQIRGPLSRVLKVKSGSAGLHVIRHYLGGGERLLLVTLSTYPSDRFSYAMRLRYDRRSNKEPQ